MAQSRQLFREKSSVLSKLRNRELCNAPTGASVTQSRKVYACIPPVHAAAHVEGLEDYLGCFVGNGEYLVCYGYSLHDVALYRFTGLQECIHGEVDDADEATIRHDLHFSRFFKLVYREAVSRGEGVLRKDFCQVAHSNKFLILASSADAPGSNDAALTPTIPLQRLVTFYVLELVTGKILDRYTIEDDCIDLTANHGAYLFDDVLAVLAVYTQEVHLLQILPSGRIIVLQHLGKHCWDDDNMILSEQAHAEARWRRSLGLATEEVVHQSSGINAAPVFEQPIVLPPAALQRAATIEDPNELPVGDELQQGALAVLPLLPEPVAGQPIILPLLAQAGLARADSAALSPPGVLSEDHTMIEGIKHRILAYLFRAHFSEGPSSEAVRKFFYDFQDYSDLMIWKAQLLDRRTLLLSTGLRNPTRTRSSNAYFLVAYDWQRGKVLSFMESQSEDMLMLYLRLTSWFHDGGVSSPWARHVTPCPFAFWCPGEQCTLRTYVPPQAAKRLMAGIPTSSYRLSLSPYLDAKLFTYDERLIEPDLRLRTYSEQALKFTSLAHPTACRFKVQPIAPPANPYQSTSRHLKQVVAYEFHPVEPLVLCLLHTPTHPAQLTLYYRA